MLERLDQRKLLDSSIDEINELFPGADAALRFIASAETDYGQYNHETALSYGPYQIDPIGYYDAVQNPGLTDKHRERINKINNYLKDRFEDPSFDITNLAIYNPETNDYIPESRNLKYLRDPLVGTALARLKMLKDPHEILPGEENLSRYYQRLWGPKWSQSQDENIKSKKRQEAIEKYRRYNTPSSTMEQAKLTNSAFTQ